MSLPCTFGGPAHTPGVTTDGVARCVDCGSLLEEPVCDDCERTIADCDAEPSMGTTDRWSYSEETHYTTEETCPRLVRIDDDARAEHLIDSMEEGA